MTTNVFVRKLEFELANAAATERLGAALARELRAPCVIWLHGDLGAGKTTLARGAIQSQAPEMRVRSPTYALIESYALPNFSLHHLDLYRVRDPSELDALDLRDLDSDVMLIEWPENGGASTPRAHASIFLSHLEGDRRRVEISADSNIGEQILGKLQQILQ